MRFASIAGFAAPWPLSLIVALDVCDRRPLVWILDIPGGLAYMAFGVYLYRVGQRGGWARKKE
jgi:hypothetical protein